LIISLILRGHLSGRMAGPLNKTGHNMEFMVVS